mgnify:CR=1 FL=1
MPAWRFAKARYTARLHGWTPFVSMQNHLNLLYREEEREMLPFCAEEGVDAWFHAAPTLYVATSKAQVGHFDDAIAA